MHYVRLIVTVAVVLTAFARTGSAQTPVTLDATSGTSTISTNYTTNGGLTLDMGFFAEYLIVGGGGGGGNNHGGGGGAGGFRTNLGGSLLQITSTNNTITVGDGGAGGTAGASTAAGNDGGASSAFGITSIGGGGGGARADQGSPTSFYVGRNGASGGGGGGIGTTPAGGTGTAGQGSNGGSGTGGGAEASGGGGGGAGATGANSSAGVAGAGGAGLASTITGSSRFYAGGGGGGTGGSSTIGAGGSGVGGSGNNGATAQPGSAGATSTGSGGGGGGGAYGVGGAGAAGIVIVRYAGSPAGTGGAVTTGSGSAAGMTVHTFATTGNSTLSIPLATRLAATLTGSITGSGTFTFAGPGTLTLAGANTSTGPTSITGGTLVTTTTGLLPTAATVTVGSGASLQLGANQTVGGLSGAGSVVLGSNTLTTAGGGQTFSGVASGLGGVTKAGPGTASFTGQNTFSGQLAIAEGTLVLGTWNDANTNGSAGNSSLPIQLGSASTSGTLSYGGPNIGTTDSGLTKGLAIAAGGGSVVITSTGGRGSFVHVTGTAITGNGTLTVSAPQARFIVIGSGQHTGATVVQEGELQGNVQLVTEATPFGAGTNGLGSAVTVNSTGVLTIYTGGNTAVTRTVLLGSLAGSGTVRGEASGPIRLRIGGDGTSTTFAGTITDSFNVPATGKISVEKTGIGAQTFSGPNTYTGSTTVSAGTLLVNGDQTAAIGAVTVADGGTLGGSGTIGGVTTIAGLHSPGNSPGVQTFASDLVYTAGADVLWELTANTTTNVPVVYDQIVVGRNLAFDGATSLALSFNAAGSAVNWGDVFWNTSRSWTLWDVAGSTGGFGNLSLTNSGWADGFGTLLASVRPQATFSLEQQGSDVVLKYEAVPEPSTLILAGLGLTAAAAIRRRSAVARSRRDRKAACHGVT